MITKKTATIIAALLATIALAGCTTNADKANENLSIAADNFEVQRHIVGVNGITGEYAFEVVGRCSINDQGHQLEVTCRHGENEYRKHMIGLSDNTFYVAEQLGAIDVSVYHTRIIIKPETLLPELELQTGKQ
ncbi:beta-sandwich lipoprotein [Glutamicibacter mysorens]